MDHLDAHLWCDRRRNSAISRTGPGPDGLLHDGAAWDRRLVCWWFHCVSTVGGTGPVRFESFRIPALNCRINRAPAGVAVDKRQKLKRRLDS